MPVTRLDKLLKSGTSGRLGKIIRNAQDMQALTVALRARLPGALAPELLSASVRDGDLVLLCSSPAFASRLRFEGGTLLGAARELGLEVGRCRVRVAR